MGRTVAVIWHASFSLAGGVLYFFFVLPRTLELLGDISHTQGTALRIITGALIGLAALPVVFTLLRTRRPELSTPKLALTLRTSSIGLHVLAAALIIGAAVSEIWLTLDSAGQSLFGIYGAAAAIALLGVLAFYLAFIAELPPPPPKPLKVEQRKTRRGRKGSDPETVEPETAEDSGEIETSEATEESEVAEVTAEDTVPTAETDSEPEIAAAVKTDAHANGKLQNRRPTGKGTVLGRRKRTRGGVAVED
jgi:hypothetical protein